MDMMAIRKINRHNVDSGIYKNVILFFGSDFVFLPFLYRKTRQIIKIHVYFNSERVGSTKAVAGTC